MRTPIVIKIGGGAGIEHEPIAEQVAALAREGLPVVLVHGGSDETNTLAERLGHPPRFIQSPSGHTSRRTDSDTLDIFTMACRGRVNARLVRALRVCSVDAVGLSGVDGGLWTAERKGAIRSVQDGRVILIRDDLTGRVTDVDATLLRLLLEDGRTPVLSPPAITREGLAVNVDADRAAAATAVALGASELLLLSNVPGVLRDPSDPSSLLTRAPIADLRAAARGRMKTKVLAAEEAIAGGVSRIVIGTGVGPGAIRRARAGEGTFLEAAPVARGSAS
jgi:acetylglutamate/LysW-gamma-L-alpha-aminoadipate kinase